MTDRFGYVRAVSIDDALRLLNEPGQVSRPLAGSTDILLQLRHDAHYCDRLIDISLLPEIRKVEQLNGYIYIGAGVPFSDILSNPMISSTAQVLTQACQSVGAVQIRNMGTLGGNVANAAACADSLPALVCLDAVAHIQTLKDEFELPISELVTGPNRTKLPLGGLLVSISYPIPTSGSKSVFLKLGRRNAMAISRLTVAALGRLDDNGLIAEIRLVTGSATPHIERLTLVEQSLVGVKPTDEVFEHAAALTVVEMIRLSGTRWSSEFKVPALTAMTFRALSQVFDGVDST